MRTRTAIRSLAVVATALAATVPAPAGAETTLNPPPPDFYTCQTNGSGTVCHGKQSGSYSGRFDGTCPQGFDILENGFIEETAARYYDRDGNLVRRVLHDRWPATADNILYNSQTGKSVRYTADITEFDTFAAPGDFDTVTARFVGNHYTVTVPGDLLVHDVGVLGFGPDGSIVENHGPKMLFLGDTAELCAALA
jgi:hypothetical protein